MLLEKFRGSNSGRGGLLGTAVRRKAPAARTAARLRVLRPLPAARRSCVGVRLARFDAGAAASRKRRRTFG